MSMLRLESSKVKCFSALVLVLVLLLLLAGVVYVVEQAGYGLTYQVSASMPRGFYFISPTHHLYRGEIVVFKPPTRMQRLLHKHHWAPDSGLLMKHVMAVSGDQVCYRSKALWINNQRIAPIYHFYAPGKRLPQYHFCGKLKPDQYLLISTKVKKSFDSRYFGPIGRQKIIGKAIKLF